MNAKDHDPRQLFSMHWLKKAEDDLASAASDVEIGRFDEVTGSLPRF